MKNIARVMIALVMVVIFFLSFSMSVFADNLNSLQNTGDNSITENFINVTTNNEISNNTINKINESDVDSETTEMDRLELEKSEIENAIAENEAQIGIVEGELSVALEEVEEISCKILNKQTEINRLEAQELALMEYIEETEKELEIYTERFNTQEEMVEKRLIAMYEMGEIKYLDVLLNSENISDFLSRYYLISEISEADIKLLKEFQVTKEKTESLNSSLIEKKNELEETKKKCEKDRVALSNMEILKRNKVNNLNGQELELYAEIEEYQNQIKTIEQEIKKLALANIGDEYIGGKMAWPVPGYNSITSPFGMRTHPITGIYKLHTGVDVGAPMGASFIAANDGVVIKAERNGAYGNMVMINHGGGIVTLYAHGSEILVNVGDIVTQGTAVLKVGSTGYSTGPHAHFEVIVNGEYVDPLDYITSYNAPKDTESVIVEIN